MLPRRLLQPCLVRANGALKSKWWKGLMQNGSKPLKAMCSDYFGRGQLSTPSNRCHTPLLLFQSSHQTQEMLRRHRLSTAKSFNCKGPYQPWHFILFPVEKPDIMVSPRVLQVGKSCPGLPNSWCIYTLNPSARCNQVSQLLTPIDSPIK